MEDSTTQASLLHGRELKEWRALKTHPGLVELYKTISNLVGPRFMWRQVVESTFIRSCLDCLYYSSQGWWVHSFHGLLHLSAQILSDHNLVLLTCHIHAPLSSSMKKASYFKAYPNILSIQDHCSKIHIAWAEGLWGGSDPKSKFYLVSRKLWNTYQHIQKGYKKLTPKLKDLCKDLTRIKLQLSPAAPLTLVMQYIQTSSSL